MKIRVIWVGRTKEEFVRAGIAKYLRLLSPFCRIETVELRDARDSIHERAVRKEGERILKAADNFVLLHERGRELTSAGFAGFIAERGNLDFVIGGAFGVSPEVEEKAGEVLSLSKMTFTHEMARVILLEQIYRALTIINRRGYHH